MGLECISEIKLSGVDDGLDVGNNKKAFTQRYPPSFLCRHNWMNNDAINWVGGRWGGIELEARKNQKSYLDLLNLRYLYPSGDLELTVTHTHLSVKEEVGAVNIDLHVNMIRILLNCMGLGLNPQRRQWHPTLVLLPGKSHGQRSLVGCSPWGR